MDEPPAARSNGTRSSGTVTAVVTRHPVAAFLVLVFVITGVLAALPIPDLAFGPIENTLGAAVPAVIVTAVVGGRAGVRDLGRRALRWRVSPRWYAVSLLGLPAVLLVLAPALWGTAPLGALAENWPLLITSFLPTLVFMIVLNNVAEEAAWTGFLFARLEEVHAPLRAALLVSVPFCGWHFVSFVHDTRSVLAGAALTAYLLLPLVASRIVVGWLYNSSGASVLIAGLFHGMHNATVNPTGFGVAVLDLPQDEVLFVVGVLVMLAAVTVVFATRRRLGLPRAGEPEGAEPAVRSSRLREPARRVRTRPGPERSGRARRGPAVRRGWRGRPPSS
jgi:membrane protease YdiL (CAAX protease family)